MLRFYSRCTKGRILLETETDSPIPIADWRILAEEAAQEKDPQKLMQIVDALTRALEEKETKKSA